jgi:hypothetical protein
VRLNVALAPSFSECASTIVASRSTITGPEAGTGRRCAQATRPAAARAPRIAATASPSPARTSTSRDTVGSEATGPNSSGWARTTATSARQSPPSAIAAARSSTTLPGSCAARGARHRANASVNDRSSPAARAVSASSVAPAEESNDSLPAANRTRLERPLRFTHGVPSRSDQSVLRHTRFFLAGQALPCLHATCPERRSAHR